MAEIADGHHLSVEIDLRPGQPVVRAGKETLQHPQFAQDLHGRGVNRVTAKIAKEVGMLFQHQHRNPGARQQQARDHSCRTAPDNYDIHFGWRIHAVTFAPDLQ